MKTLSLSSRRPRAFVIPTTEGRRDLPLTWRSLALLGMTMVVLFFTPGTSFAYSSSICDTNSAPCTEKEVGPFMKDISDACGNSGDCSLNDIMQVFVNVGNWIVGIIGFIVLLMYVVGGFYWLASAGRKEWVDKGKKYMTISTAGLLIVMFSALGIYAIKGALQYGTLAVEGDYYVCSGDDTLGKSCDLNSTCTENGCESLCRQKNPNFYETEDGIFTVLTYNDCVDTSADGMGTSDSESDPWYSSGSCQRNLCPGGDEVQCCEVHYFY